MSRPHQPLTPSISSQGFAPSSSKFKEHLSISLPQPIPVFERSWFSPDTPAVKIHPLGRRFFNWSSPRSWLFDPERGPASDSIQISQSSQPSIRNSLSRHFSTLRKNDSFVQPLAPNVAAPPSEPPVPVPVWRRFRRDYARESDIQHPRYVRPRPTRTLERYSPALLFALMVFLLCLFVNVIILDIRSFSPSHSSLGLLPTTPAASASTNSLTFSSTTPAASASTNTIAVSEDTQQCLTQYSLNAANNPEGYPCSTCLPLLMAVPTNSSPIYPVARDATQFCGLRSIWEDASQQGQARLKAGGWVKNVRFCTWSGVQCNGAGRVSSLYVSSSSRFSPTEFNRVLHVDD